MAPSDWIARWTTGPATLIGEGIDSDSFTVIDTQARRVVEPSLFKSKSRNMPFAGLHFDAWPVLTVFKGKVVYQWT